jgi:hypothetical protein
MSVSLSAVLFRELRPEFSACCAWRIRGSTSMRSMRWSGWRRRGRAESSAMLVSGRKGDFEQQRHRERPWREWPFFAYRQ